MPIPMASNILPSHDVNPLKMLYPANTKQAAGMLDGVLTDVMVILFVDKIMVTLTQAGRLAQWVWLLVSLRCASH